MTKFSKAIRILLVRHGETDWNRIHRFQGRSDIPLNSRGRKQARALARALKTETLTSIYTSPLSRAVETARTIGTFHPNTPLFMDDGLIEMDLGEFDGMSARSWSETYPDFRDAWRQNPAALRMPGGETLSEVQFRARETVENITQSYRPGCTLVMASHNFVILSLLCHATQVPLSRFRELRQETAAFAVLYKTDETLWADALNCRAHLDEVENE